ncbi:MAG: ABC transporter permease [Candidatus Poseidoniaceae archaeon]
MKVGTKQWLLLEMNTRLVAYVAVATYTLLIVIPLWLAVDRLVWVAGFDVTGWISSLDENYISKGVFQFTIMQAVLSSIATLAIGIPIAWQLGRYEWPFQTIIRSLLTMPFVMPSIVAAMGFMHLIGENGLNIRNDSSTWLWVLIIAHAWFNLSLVIRFCEPVLSTLDPSLEEQLRLLPEGRTRLGRFRYLWFPLLIPSIAAAACMTFVFSFTSFALVKWITLGENTLESMMADIGSSAGIPGYMISKNEVILGSSLIQFTVLLFSLWLMTWLQNRRQSLLPAANEKIVKTKNNAGWLVIIPAICFAVIPLATLIVSSFRVTETNLDGSRTYWSTEGWSYAFSATNSLPSGWDALYNSIGYALICLMIALPLGWTLAQTINDLEENSPRLARILDVFTMLPFAVSSVMIGLGVMLGMIKINPEFFYSIWFTPVIAHIMITTPFVVRIILPAMRSFDAKYDECGQTLGMSKIKRFFLIKLPMLRGSILVAAIFTIAMSLGEFGASWVVTRNSDWTTLPVMIDSIRAFPYNEPLVPPAANAVSSVLMLIALILFISSEKFRPKRDGGMF